MEKRIVLLMVVILAVAGLFGCSGNVSDKQESASGEAPAAITEESQDVSETFDAERTEQTGKEVELIVFAAASLTETLTEIAEMYKDEAPDVTLIFNFDSSGTLKTQIEEGADCDLFISAGQLQMNQLDITADSEVNTDKLDFVDGETRIDILENKVTLCVPKGNPAGIENFDALANILADGDVLMAMGNSDVPVGQYMRKILDYYKLNEQELANAGKITYGTNVKEVTTQIIEASVDCGVVYCTDAFSAGLAPVDYATAEMCGRVIYPAAVLKTGIHTDEAKAFLDYLTTDKAMAVFKKVGFSAVE